MTMRASDITFYLTGGASNSNPQASLGGNKSNTSISDFSLGNLWDKITGTNHALGNVDTGESTDYRVIALKVQSPLSDSSTSKLYNALLSFEDSDLGDNEIEVAVASAVNTILTSGGDENTPPTEGGSPLTFQSIPTNGIELPSPVSPGDEVHIAFKRTINSGASNGTPFYTLQISGDTNT